MSALAWQPIETAPRDGSLFIAYRPLAANTDDAVIKIVRGLPRDNGCWKATVPAGLDETNYTDGCCKPTHWMPLPAPPGKPTAQVAGDL